jgi:hypothetical protein
MLRTHPGEAMIDRDLLAEVIHTLASCADTCTACADACLGEEQVGDLRRCIRLNLDCADSCQTAANMLLRQTEPDLQVLRATVEACALACRSCGEECEKHAEMHEHCRVCAEACRRCEDACQRALQALGCGPSSLS